MKLTLILIIAFVLHAGARGTAQTVTLSVTNMPLAKVCKEIEKQTGYYFVYATDLEKYSRSISVEIDHATITDALRQVFEGLTVTYEVIEKVIVVNTINNGQSKVPAIKDPEEKMISVTGVVLSEKGQALQGASVSVKATGKTTLTNERGEFSFSSIPGNSVLVISFIGYSSKQIVAKGTERIQVLLSQSTDPLDELVIKGYYNTSNRLNTGNVSIVKGADVQKQPVTDPLLALEGRVPGLYIQQASGYPGAYSTIQLRGQNSIFNANSKLGTVNDPLFIIDGVPYSTQTLTSTYFGVGGALGTPDNSGNMQGAGLSPFNNLNPADIDRIEVLKDADATAIYGARGANGVIIITTKKGRSGASKFDINLYTGAGKVTRKLKMLNTAQYLAMRREALKNDGLTPRVNDWDINGTWDTTRYTDWQKVLIGNASKFTNAQMNLSGGNATTQYMLTGGYSDQGMVIPGDFKDRKISARLGITHSSENQKFHLQAGAGYVNDNNNYPNSDPSTMIGIAPDAPALFDANGNLNWELHNGGSKFNNPLSYLYIRNTAITTTLLSNVNVGVVLLPGLDLRANAGFTHSQLNQTNITPTSYLPPPDNQNPSGRSAYFATSDLQTWIVEPQLNFRKGIDKGSLDIMTGMTIQQNESHSTTSQATDYPNDGLIPNPLAASNYYLYANDYTQYRYNAMYVRVGYNLMDKYILNLTGRRDGSSRFGPSKQFGNFGAVGIAWIFSKEPFVERLFPALSFGKIRASYGVTGNDAILDYQYMSTYRFISSTYLNVTALSPSRIPNPYFGWEVVRKLEAGLEVGFLKDKLLFTASYYRNRTGNQLTGAPLPATAGFNSVEANLPAVIQNSGVEFTLNISVLKTRDITWSLSGNVSKSWNKLKSFQSLNNNTEYFGYVYTIGKSLFTRKLNPFIGVNSQTGLYSFATKSGNGSPVSQEDIVYKEVKQNYFGGIQNSLSYKNWTLDIFIQFVNQSKPGYIGIFNMPGKFLSGNPLAQNQPVYVLDRWQSVGNMTSVQKFSTKNQSKDAYNYMISSDANIVDASFIRVKNVAIAYQLPNVWNKKVHSMELRLYLQCQNIFLITKYKGFDPETGGIGLPPLRMMTAGIQLKF